MQFLNLKHKRHFRVTILKPLLEKKLLKETIPDKPTSPKQKYIAVSDKKGIKKQRKICS